MLHKEWEYENTSYQLDSLNFNKILKVLEAKTKK